MTYWRKPHHDPEVYVGPMIAIIFVVVLIVIAGMLA